MFFFIYNLQNGVSTVECSFLVRAQVNDAVGAADTSRFKEVEEMREDN